SSAVCRCRPQRPVLAEEGEATPGILHGQLEHARGAGPPGVVRSCGREDVATMTRWARALFQLAFASIALLGCLRDPDTVERDLRNQIQQELPIGTDKSQVISFLRRHNIGEFVYGEKTRTIYAKIRDVARWRLSLRQRFGSSSISMRLKSSLPMRQSRS